MISSMEKDFLEKCTSGDEIRPLLRDLFQHERYEDIVEAIELHVCTLGNNKDGRRDYIHKHVVRPFISNMITKIGNEPFGFKQGLWEDFFKTNNKDGKTWEDSILESLQSGSTGAFSRGIQAIKQSIIDFNKTR